jgi:hypothetical protein
MKIRELKGKEMMKAYDGKYLSRDFGYSCANFNTGVQHENDDATFEFYVKNPKNISCFVAYNDIGKICGRRMFFKGKSLIDDELFESPVKKGDIVKYLYGYYGCENEQVFREISRAAIMKYRKGVIYTDRVTFIDGMPDYGYRNRFIMQVENADCGKFPPIDILRISTEIKALANFDPSDAMLDAMEKELNSGPIEFHQAYRYKKRTPQKRFDYRTWADNYKFKKDEEEDEEDDVFHW